VSDTPRTDAKAQFFGWNPDEGEEFVTASFCRELERENAALRDALNTALGIEYLDEEILEKLIERLRLIIQEQNIPPKDSKL
jgi:hypothetical protein